MGGRSQGALAYVQNGTNLYTTEIYNSRLQPCWIYSTTGSALAWNTTPCTATDPGPANIIDFQYNFGLGAGDNGNVIGITNNRDTTRSQAFSYDALNRLLTAETTSTYSTSPAHCWGEAYFYDNQPSGSGAWGNLTSIGGASSSYNGCTQEGLSVTANTNNQISGFCYDAAGNLLQESTCPAGPPYTYTYNAEHQITSTAGVTYSYDGDGKRIEKSGGKIYWYGGSSTPLDETDLSGNTNNSTFSEYVYFGGARTSRRDYQGNIFYYFADHLGTSREMVQSGQTSPCYDADFYPFGGERSYTTTCTQNYKFTGKERDSESGLDDFDARYYSSSKGRFMSPDWSAAPQPVPYANLSNPQTLNLYAVVRDNPETFADLDGHCEGEHCDRITVSAKVSKEPEVTSSKNGRVSSATVEAEVQYTIKQNGKAMADTPIHEEVSNKVTRNGTSEQSKTETRDDSTNKQGVIGDTTSHTISTSAPSSPGTNLAEQILTTSTISKETTQTLTIGNTGCQVTEVRTLSNKDGDYTLTLQSPKTQKATPVPTPPPPPKPPNP